MWNSWYCEIAREFRWGGRRTGLGWLFKQRRERTLPHWELQTPSSIFHPFLLRFLMLATVLSFTGTLRRLVACTVTVLGLDFTPEWTRTSDSKCFTPCQGTSRYGISLNAHLKAWSEIRYDRLGCAIIHFTSTAIGSRPGSAATDRATASAVVIFNLPEPQ